MRLIGYRIVDQLGDVDIAVPDAIDVSLEEFIASRVESLGRASGPRWLRNRDRAGELPDWTLSQPLRYRTESRTVDVTGCVVYETASGLLHFFEQHYVPTSDTGFDRLIGELQSGVPGTRSRLERLLRDYAESQQRYHRARRSVGGNGQHKPLMPVALVNADFRDTLVRPSLPIGDDRWRFLQARTHARRIVVAPTTVRYRGQDLTRLQYLLLLGNDMGRHSRFRYLLFDGKGFHFGQRLSEFPAHVIQAIERDGEICAEIGFDPLPCPHLRPRALIRVPGRNEAGALIPQTRLHRPRHAVLRRPAILRTSTEPVPLPRRLPVVADPVVGLRVLARNRDGIYLPDDAPLPLTAEHLPPESTWLILCDPVCP